MFSKAKLKRFNEEVGCAPPPTKYDARIEDRPVGVVMERSERFKENKENTPAPNAYMTVDVPKTPHSQTPRRPLSRLNASSASTSSVNSQKEFKSPPKFTRSGSLKLVRGKDQKQLSARIEELTKERDEIQEKFTELEAKIYSMELNAPSVQSAVSHMEPDSQVANENQILVEKEDYDLMREELEHLTTLRDNLETSISRKDDTIADLQIQLDLIVTQAQETEESFESLKQEMSVISEQLEQSIQEKRKVESKVSDLVKRYESMISKQKEESVLNKDLLAQKNIEIELLNDSIATLNTKVSEFENTLSLQRSPQLSALDLTISSCSSKSEDLVEKIKQLSVEESETIPKVQEEKQKNASLSKALEAANLKLKERDVVQQFLEKEIKVRENEISQNAWQIEKLTTELTTTQMLVAGLQREAETQLNQLFCLKATLSAKEYDIEAKDDLISSLADEVLKKDQAVKCTTTEAGTSTLEGEINYIKDILLSGRQNASQLEERVIELLAEVDERESQYKKQLQLKDSELEEISLNYSDALLQQEALKRLINATTEQLESSTLVYQALKLDHHNVQEELNEKKTQCSQLERNLTELTVKITHLEDALACEEEGSQNMQEDLEGKIEELQATCQQSQQELAKLQSTNEGFVSQITQLRIDMTKKCCAVEEMQKCIDALREEKISQASAISQLKGDYEEKDTLLNDLQEEFEDKMKKISELKDDLQQKDSVLNNNAQELEKSGSQLRLVIAERDTLQQRLYDSQCEFQTMEAERNQIQQAMWDHEGEFNEALEHANREIEELKRQLEITNQESGKEIYDLEVKLKNLEEKFNMSKSEAKQIMASLSEKTSLLEDAVKAKNEMSMNLEIQQLASLNANTQLEKLTADFTQAKQHVLERDDMLSQLNHQMLEKTDAIHELLKQVSQRDNQVDSLQEQISRLESEVESMKGEKGSHEEMKQQLQEKLDKIKSLKTCCKELEIELMNLKSSSKTREKELTMINMSLLEESQSWKNKFTYLEDMIEPFREQLDTYDMEKAALISKNAEAKKEIDKLSKDYAKLIGHTNHKQKIQHMVKLKDQNNQLKEEVQKLRYEVEQIKHQKKAEKTSSAVRSRATEKTYPSERENKENESDYSSSPLRSSNRLHRI